MVSGTISLPSRGSFHLSLTVLVHYRSSKVFSLTRLVLVASCKVILPRSTQDRYSFMSSSGFTPVKTRKIEFFYLRDYHPLWFLFPEDLIKIQFCNFPFNINEQRIIADSLFDDLKKFLSYNPQNATTKFPEHIIKFNFESEIRISIILF